MQEEFKTSLNSEKPVTSSVQIVLFFHFLTQSVNFIEAIPLFCQYNW